MKATACYLLLLFGLIACSDDDDDVVVPPPVAVPSFKIVGPENNSAHRGQSIALVLLTEHMQANNIQWTQLTGSELTLTQTRSHVLGFDVPEANTYSIRLNFTDDSDQSHESIYTFTATEPTDPLVNARLDHAAIESARASLRVVESLPGNAIDIVWEQVAGPTVTLSNPNSSMSYFDLPEVDQNTLLTFKVTVTDDQSNSASDEVHILVENRNFDRDALFPKYLHVVADVYPYNAQSAYASVLAACAYSNDLTTSCTLDTLPLIGQETVTPSVDNIMDRVVVSHPWMGDSFKSFLETEDPHDDFKNLLRATTAIVISYDVTPTFYWQLTGALYLDPNMFWRSQAERYSVNEYPDPGLFLGRELQFQIVNRYVKDNNYVTFGWPYIPPITRTFEFFRHEITAPLYHQLAHANDQFPPDSWAGLNRTLTVREAADQLGRTSTDFAQNFPLLSEEMKSLAKVKYYGEESTDAERGYQPADISPFFSPDDGLAFKSFLSPTEDYAILFEEFMMAARYEIQSDVGVTARSHPFIVDWGERGRIAKEAMKPKIRALVQKILPDLEVNTVLNDLPSPLPMTQGLTWDENLDLTTTPKKNTDTQEN